MLILLEYAIIIQNKIINQIHNLLLQAQRVFLSLLGAYLLRQEFHTSILLNELSLAIEIVCLQEGRKTSKYRFFHCWRLLIHKLLS